MDPVYESHHLSLEKTHWWFVGRRDMILRLLQGTGLSAAILDIGCSGGCLELLLNEKGFCNATGMDISRRAVDAARESGANVLFGDGTNTRFADGSFDVIIASDVLEHMRDDAAALAEWKRLLRSGGKLILFAPAFGFLWSRHDEVLMHFRRYSRAGLLTALRDSGFEIVRSSYWNSLLFFPYALLTLLQRLVPPSGGGRTGNLSVLPRAMNGLLAAYLKAENSLIWRLGSPFGISLFAVAVKRGPDARGSR